MTAGSSFVNLFGAGPIVPANPSYEELTIAVDTALVWPQETTGGDPYVARQIDVTAAVASLSLAMPPANTGSRGGQSLVTNVGAEIFTVTDTAGNQIVPIEPTQTWLITLTDNSTVNGGWRAYQLAATIAEATAAALAGPGLQAIGSRLQTIWTTRRTSVTGAIVLGDRSTLVIWDGTTGTLVLAAAATLTDKWFCAVSNEGSGAVVLSTTGALINGHASISIAPGNSGIVVCDGTDFNTIGALIGVVPITGGGTGATTADAALTNLGGTSLGKSIFEAPSAAAARAILGVTNSSFIETTVSVGQVLSDTSSNLAFVCTATLALTLPLTTTLSTRFVICVSAVGGDALLNPQPTDSIDGRAAGLFHLIRMGQSVMLFTDANGNWFSFFNGFSAFRMGTGTTDGTGFDTVTFPAFPTSCDGVVVSIFNFSNAIMSCISKTSSSAVIYCANPADGTGLSHDFSYIAFGH